MGAPSRRSRSQESLKSGNEYDEALSGRFSTRRSSCPSMNMDTEAAALKSALAYGMVLNEMFRHTEFMKMAAYTMAISTLDYHANCLHL